MAGEASCFLLWWSIVALIGAAIGDCYALWSIIMGTVHPQPNEGLVRRTVNVVLVVSVSITLLLCTAASCTVFIRQIIHFHRAALLSRAQNKVVPSPNPVAVAESNPPAALAP